MADPFWTKDRIAELERDLANLSDPDEETSWLREKLDETGNGEKPDLLTTLDNISDVQTIYWEGEMIPKYNRLIGWLKDWRKEHGG